MKACVFQVDQKPHKNNCISGDPCAPHIQEILFWQTKTMSMMYRKVAKAIKKHEVEAHPCDYLNFFCLGEQHLKLLIVVKYVLTPH